MKKSLSLSALLFAALAAVSNAGPPNVLIIHTDEHNFRTLGCYRKLMSQDQAYVWGEGVAVETPNIDWLAETGAICSSCYATSPVCTPSRASFVSGLYPQNTGAISNNHPLLDEVETFAEVLRREGYATGYAGKWHLDGPAKPGWTPERKFGFEDNLYLFNRGHWKKLGEDENGPRVAAVNAKGQPNYDVEGADAESFTTDFLADRTVEFIRKNRDKPFCFMVSIPDPHGPNTVRPPYDTMFDNFDFQQPASARAEGKGLPSFSDVVQDRFNARQMSLYFGMVRCIDDNVGKILDALRETGLIDGTIVIFTSDHGDMCGELGRHNKGIPGEGSSRIPFVIRAPGIVPPGEILTEVLGTVDFKPTLLGLLGVKGKVATQGRDASALFRTGKVPAGWEDITFVRIGAQPTAWFGAFTSRSKLVLSPGNGPAFFDLEKDPNELRNAIGLPEHREEIRRLARALKEYGERCADPYLIDEAIRSDLEWAINGGAGESAPVRKPAAMRSGKGKGKKGKAGGEEDE